MMRYQKTAPVSNTFHMEDVQISSYAMVFVLHDSILRNASDSDIRTLLQFSRFSRNKLVISIREEKISENNSSL